MLATTRPVAIAITQSNDGVSSGCCFKGVLRIEAANKTFYPLSF